MCVANVHVRECPTAESERANIQLYMDAAALFSKAAGTIHNIM